MCPVTLDRCLVSYRVVWVEPCTKNNRDTGEVKRIFWGFCIPRIWICVCCPSVTVCPGRYGRYGRVRLRDSCGFEREKVGRGDR